MRPYWDEENTFGYLRFDLAEYRSIAAYKTYPKYFQTWEYAQWVYFHRKIQYIKYDPGAESYGMTHYLQLPLSLADLFKNCLEVPFGLDISIPEGTTEWETVARETLSKELQESNGWRFSGDLRELVDTGLKRWEIQPYGKIPSPYPEKMALAAVLASHLLEAMEADGCCEEDILKIWSWNDRDFFQKMCRKYKVRR